MGPKLDSEAVEGAKGVVGSLDREWWRGVAGFGGRVGEIIGS